MSEQPPGWTTATVGQVCDLINGKAFKPADWLVSGLPIVRIQNLNNPEAKFNYSSREVDQKFLIENGELLFAWSGTPGTSFGAHVWGGGEAVLNQHIFKLKFPEELFDKIFLRHAINQRLIELIGKAHGGAGLAHLTKGRFESTQLTVPPAAEQRRIVAKIDRLSSRSKRACAELNRVDDLVLAYKRALLRTAFLGDLTLDWRGTQRKAETELVSEPNLPADIPAIPSTWAWISVGRLASKVSDGVHKKPVYTERGVPFLTVKDLTAGPGISFDDCKYVSSEDHKEFVKRTRPERGDILISKDGTLRVIRAVRTDRIFSIFVSVALVKPQDRSLTDYLELAFLSPQVQMQMVGVGTGLQHIHLTDLRKDLIPVAPPSEREEIVRRIKHAFAAVDRLAAEARSARPLLDKLDQAILAKAFRGELVPQDPNDEPASVLLERIGAERAAAPATRRRTARAAT